MTLVRRSFVIAAIHLAAVLAAVVAGGVFTPVDGEESSALGPALLDLAFFLGSPAFPIWRTIRTSVHGSNAV